VVSSPNSTSRRTASGRAGLSFCLAAQASTLARSSDERRMVVRTSCPVLRRPLFFRTMGLRCAAIRRAKVFRPGNLTPGVGDNFNHSTVATCGKAGSRHRSFLKSGEPEVFASCCQLSSGQYRGANAAGW
jgi:hypothetical protein